MDVVLVCCLSVEDDKNEGDKVRAERDTAVATASAMETLVSKQAFRITHLIRAIESGGGGGGVDVAASGGGQLDLSVRKGSSLTRSGRWQ